MRFAKWTHWLKHAPCWKVLLLFVALSTVLVACVGLFEWRSAALWPDRDAKSRPVGPDGRYFGYSATDLHAYFDAIGSAGRGQYVATQLTLDVLFPLTYGSLIAAFFVVVYPRPTRWVLLPAAVVVMDLSENFLLVALASTFEDAALKPAWVRVASVAAAFTIEKWVLVFACLPVAVNGVVLGFGGLLRRLRDCARGGPARQLAS